MGVFEAGAMAIRGHWDCFDRAIGAIEHIEGLLAETEIPVEFHAERETFDGERKCEAHFLDRKDEMQAELASAKEMISEACQIAQNVIADMP